MKKLLLIALVAGGFMLAGAPRSDAQVYFSVGFGFPGYYGYGCYPYGYYYPYRYYYRPYYRGYYRPYYWSGGRRDYRHHYPNYYYRR
ncbi:MAG: hypothetical protein ACM3KL_07900 [Alphaproteobacteria bacterium]